MRSYTNIPLHHVYEEYVSFSENGMHVPQHHLLIHHVTYVLELLTFNALHCYMLYLLTETSHVDITDE